MPCEICGKPFIRRGNSCTVTLVGYYSPPGHDHDDNCRTRVYVCAEGHKTPVSIINRCPQCNWQGKAKCFCSVRVEQWPEVSVGS